MPKLTTSAPILLVTDVVASAAYWRETMGFTYERFWGEPPNFVILERDNLNLMLAKADPAHIKPHWKVVHQMWNVYFWTDDARKLYEEFQEAGARIDYTLGMKPYGVLEFGVQDLDGYDIGFGEIV